MIAGIEDERVKTGTVKMGRQREHQGGIPAPTMKDDNSGSGSLDRDEPTVEPGAIDAAKPHLLLGQPKISRGLLIGSLWWGEHASHDPGES
jgi:hypothetical protein